MVKDWISNKKLIARWLDTVGSEQHPRGDIYREIVLNPTLLGAMLCSQSVQQHPEEAGFWNPLSLTEKLIQRISSKGKRKRRALDAAVARWYNDLPENEPINLLEGKSVLDLGAGEGYLGRWFNAMRSQTNETKK